MDNAQTNPQPALMGFDPRELFAKGLQLETADLLVGAPTSQTIGRLSALCLMAFKDQSGKPAFRTVTVVAPPLGAWPMSDEDILEAVREGVMALAGQSLSPQELESVRRRLNIRRCPDLNAKGLVDEVNQLTQSFVIVPMAHVYRDASVLETGTPGAADVRLAEHMWVPHLTVWSDECVKSLKSSGNYLVLATPGEPPRDKRHMEQLASVDDLYPVYFKTDEGEALNALIAENLHRWTGLAVAGRVDEALAEINALDIETPVKRQLEIQALNRSGQRERTLDALKVYVEEGGELPPDMAVRFGRIAFRSGDAQLAGQLIGSGVDGALDLILLEHALVTCESLGDDALTLRLAQRLKSLFPESPFLDRYRESGLIRLSGAIDPSSFGASLSTIAFTEFEAEVAKAFISPSKTGMDALITTAGAKSPRERDLALLCCATYALAHLEAAKGIGSRAVAHT